LNEKLNENYPDFFSG